MKEAFLLHQYNNLYSEHFGDKLIFFSDVTMVAGSGSVATIGTVKKGTTVPYVICKQATTNATTGVLTATVAVAGDTDTVTVMVIADVKDMAPSSEQP